MPKTSTLVAVRVEGHLGARRGCWTMDAVKYTRFPMRTVRVAVYEDLCPCLGRGVCLEYRLLHGKVPRYTKLGSDPVKSLLTRVGSGEGEQLISTLLALEQIHHSARVLHTRPADALTTLLLKQQSSGSCVSCILKAKQEPITQDLLRYSIQMGCRTDTGFHTLRKHLLNLSQ
jgi:hypothetical protein